jgi:hypothetical protein
MTGDPTIVIDPSMRARMTISCHLILDSQLMFIGYRMERICRREAICRGERICRRERIYQLPKDYPVANQFEKRRCRASGLHLM